MAMNENFVSYQMQSPLQETIFRYMTEYLLISTHATFHLIFFKIFLHLKNYTSFSQKCIVDSVA
jgi:hypothetical protein